MAKRRLTAADWALLPECRAQLVDGEIIMNPTPELSHQFVMRSLLHALHQFAESVGGEAIPGPFDLYLPCGDIYQPDLIYLSRERRNLLQANGVHGVPDLVIEVLDSDRELDLGRKFTCYERDGLHEYWVVDPQIRLVTQYLLNQGKYQAQALPEDGMLRSPTGFTLATSAIFRELDLWLE